MSNEQTDHAHVIPIPPPLLYAVPLLLGIVLRRRAPGLPLPNWLRQTLGAILAIAGIGGSAWFFRTLQQASTTYIPDRPVSSLVVTGPFAYTRNPGYLSMAAIYSGVSLMANAPAALGMLPAILLVITRGVIGPEEQYLERRFGESYRGYKGRVGRWL